MTLPIPLRIKHRKVCWNRELKVHVLGGTWFLLANYNCTDNPLISPLSALINMVISTVIIRQKVP